MHITTRSAECEIDFDISSRIAAASELFVLSQLEALKHFPPYFGRVQSSRWTAVAGGRFRVVNAAGRQVFSGPSFTAAMSGMLRVRRTRSKLLREGCYGTSSAPPPGNGCGNA